MFSYDEGVLADVLWEELATAKRTVVDLKAQLVVATKTIEHMQGVNEDLHMMANHKEEEPPPEDDN
tara:strand:+ start:1052 stop:1249 length:198 start_codon:yes stop_codon:yes gene_type:complete